MFWKFHLDTAGIDTLLAKEDVTLKEVLDKEDILQECKTQNNKLIEYLIREDIIKELIHLVVDQPEDDIEETLKFKYMNLACEVITSDVDAILDKIANCQELLDILWAYIETQTPLNPLTASFFSKVFTHLICRKSDETFTYLKSHDAVNKLIVHIEISAIMELFVNFLKYTIVEDSQLRLEISRWLNDSKLIDKLIELLHPSNTEEVHYNVAQLLGDLIRIGRDTISQEVGAEEDPLLLTFESKDTIESLFSVILDNCELGNSDSTVVNGISIVNSLLEIKRPAIEGMEELITQKDVERIAQGVHSTIDVLSGRFKDLHKILIKPRNISPMETTFGTLDPPLGKVRLNIAGLVTAAIATNTKIINEELAKTEIIQTLLDLFSCYEWNNFVHSHVFECIRAILCSENLNFIQNEEETNEGEEEEKKTEELNDSNSDDSTDILLKHLFEDCNIIDKCLRLWEANEIGEKSGKPRKGYMGYLTKIFNEIVHAKENGPNNETIKSFFNNVEEELQKEWNELVTTSLEETNKKNICIPMNPFEYEEDSQYRPLNITEYEGTLQQAFENYQVQPMTNEFIETFGYDENLDDNEGVKNPFADVGKIDFTINANEISDNEKLFSNICEQKIKAFDDSDDSDEEDIWEEKQLTFASPTQARQTRTAVGTIGSDSDSSDDETTNNVSTDSTKLGQPTKEADEKMEVDSEWTANFDIIGMEVQEDPNWPTKDVITPKDNTTLPSTLENFADFTNISKFEISSNANNPPVAMETEGTKSIGAATAYEVTMDTADEGDRNISVTSEAPTTTTAIVGLGVARGYVVIDSNDKASEQSTPNKEEKSTEDPVQSNVTSITVKSTIASKSEDSVPIANDDSTDNEPSNEQLTNDSMKSSVEVVTISEKALNVNDIQVKSDEETITNGPSSFIEAADVSTAGKT